MLTDARELTSTFEQLDTLLLRWKSFWQIMPFEYLDLPWRQEMPLLTRWLDSLSIPELQAFDTNPDLHIEVLSPFITDASAMHAIAKLDRFPITRQHFDSRLKHRVPGRKWAQITAFAGSIPFDDAPILEWCAGKGHLGRLLSCSYGAPVTSIERNATLCRQGQTFADQMNAHMRFHTVNVLSEEAGRYIEAGHHAVALHACGDLHLQLLREGGAHRCRAISVAPCCYHLIGREPYRPLSSIGQTSALRLNRFDLKLPLQEAVIASNRIMRFRVRELCWRLGFDLLQRKLRNKNKYLKVPAVKEVLLHTDFPTFCRWAAEQRGIPLPANIDFAGFEEKGRQRRIVVSRIELVRHLFQRPLELWLLLDRAIFLQEQGYRVTMGTFCEKQLTPRNVLIHGVLGGFY